MLGVGGKERAPPPAHAAAAARSRTRSHWRKRTRTHSFGALGFQGLPGSNGTAAGEHDAATPEDADAAAAAAEGGTYDGHRFVRGLLHPALWGGGGARLERASGGTTTTQTSNGEEEEGGPTLTQPEGGWVCGEGGRACAAFHLRTTAPHPPALPHAR